MIRLCRDCRYYRAEPNMRSLDKCLHPLLAKAPDLVRGDPQTTFCDSARADSDKCGPDAVRFEPIPVREVA